MTFPLIQRNSTWGRLVLYSPLLLILLSVWLLNTFTPWAFDDWCYQYIWGTPNRINRVSDIVDSQYTHYFTQNGRVVAQSIEQFFVSITPKWFFNICNSISFACFILLLSRLTPKNIGVFESISIAAITSITLYPSFNECFLWSSGSCNYLWSATLFLLFHFLLFKSVGSHNNIVQLPLSLLVGILCGWTHEAIVLPAFVGYAVSFFICKVKLTRRQSFQFIGFMIGALLLVVSPGSLHRLSNSGNNTHSLSTAILSFISILGSLRIFWLMIIITSFSMIRQRTSIKQIVRNFPFELIALLFAFLFVVASGARYPRAYFGIELFSLIFLMRSIPNYLFLTKSQLWIANIALFLLLIPVLIEAKSSHNEALRLEEKAQKTKDGLIGFYEHPLGCWAKRFIQLNHISQYDEFYDGFIADAESNMYWRRGFNKDTILLLPQLFIEKAQNEPGLFNEWNDLDSLPFYAKLITNNSNQYKTATFLLKRNDDIPLIFQPIAKYFNRYTTTDIKTDKIAEISIQRRKFIVVKKNDIVDDRVVDIKLNP